MEDARLSLTKCRLASLRMEGPGLKRLACQFVARNVDLYTDDCRDGRLQLNSLPAVLRQCVLDELSKLTIVDHPGDENAWGVKMKAVQQLLSQETEAFHLDWLLDFSPYSLNGNFEKVVLEMIALHAPKICVVAYNDYEVDEEDDDDDDDTMPPIKIFGASMQHSVSQMSSLRQLQMGKCLVLKMPELEDLCKRLPHLEHLEINLMFRKMDVDVDALSSSLGHLKVFIFNHVFRLRGKGHVQDNLDLKQRMALLCLQHLPNLQVISHLTTVEAEDPHFSLKSSQTLKIPSSLRHLVLDANQSFSRKQYQMLPEVTDLKILCGYRGYFQIPDWHFSKVSALYLDQIPSKEIWERFGQMYGPNLHTLGLQYWTETVHWRLSFKDIFTLCPNLEKLTLQVVHIVQDPEPYDPQLMFAHLKEFSWTGCSFEEVVLSRILSAPKLEKVDLSYMKFSKTDLRTVADLVTAGLIFRQLTSFKMVNHMTWASEISIFNACSHLVKNISAYAPKVVQVKFELKEDQSESSRIDSDSTNSDDDYSWVAQPPMRVPSAAVFQKLGDTSLAEILAAF